MSKTPSQSLVDKQLAQSQAQLVSLQSTIQAHQRKWDAQRKQIASDTEVTIATSKKAIAEAIGQAKLELADLQAVMAETEASHEARLAEYKTKQGELAEKFWTLEQDKRILTQTNLDLHEQNLLLGSEITVRQATIAELAKDDAERRSYIDMLIQKESDLEAESDRIQAEIGSRTEELDTLKLVSEDKKQELTRQVDILEQKRIDLTNEIVENRARDDKVRDNLADWAKKLEKQDENLRVREGKVSEQEKAIVRNYNLLQL